MKTKIKEDFARIVKKRYTKEFIFAESFYKKATSHSKHEHKLAYFTLINNSIYGEEFCGKTFFYSPKTIIWKPAEIDHKDSMKQASGSSFSVYVKKTYLNKIAEHTKIPSEFSEKNTFLVYLAYRLRDEFRTWDDGSRLITEGIILEMFGQVAKKKTKAEKYCPKWMNRVVERLNEEFRENLTNFELAAEANVHPVYLARSFRKFHNQTIGEYIQTRRVQYASELLLNKEIPLSEVALLSGFSDQSHFTRIFKRITRITPGAFRKKLSK